MVRAPSLYTAVYWGIPGGHMVEKEQGLERARLTKSRRSKREPIARKRGTRSQDPF